MQRREVSATTGPRMTVRFFAGWDFVAGDAASPRLAAVGYSKGVPMGGDLTRAPEGRTPSFLVRAVKDPDGANVDRVQVVKGWRDSAGKMSERVYEWHFRMTECRAWTADQRIRSAIPWMSGTPPT